MIEITPQNEALEKQNSKDFYKLLDMKDFEENGCDGDTYGWRDDYYNSYMIYKQRQKDGKFHGYIKNRRTGRIVMKITRKQRIAIRNLFWKRIDIANARYNKAKKSRQERKEQREALKPKLSIQEKQAQHCQKNIARLQANVVRNEAKMRRCNTRIKTDKKKIKYYLKRLDNL